MPLLLFQGVQTLILAVMFAFALQPAKVEANPLNSWQTSCKVDSGAITRKGAVFTFRPSRNLCDGGIFSQRSEIATDSISPTAKGAYLFETHVALTTASKDQFTLFQIHDGRFGCAPPLSVDVKSDGSLLLKSDIKTGPGESCIRGALNDATSRAKILRNGTEQKLSVLVYFNGDGGFDVTVSVDDVAQVKGTYDPSRQPDEFKSKKFYFKHGVYSKNVFDYLLTSRDLKVRKVKIGS